MLSYLKKWNEQRQIAAARTEYIRQRQESVHLRVVAAKSDIINYVKFCARKGVTGFTLEVIERPNDGALYLELSTAEEPTVGIFTPHVAFAADERDMLEIELDEALERLGFVKFLADEAGNVDPLALPVYGLELE